MFSISHLLEAQALLISLRYLNTRKSTLACWIEYESAHLPNQARATPWQELPNKPTDATIWDSRDHGSTMKRRQQPFVLAETFAPMRRLYPRIWSRTRGGHGKVRKLDTYASQKTAEPQ